MGVLRKTEYKLLLYVDMSAFQLVFTYGGKDNRSGRIFAVPDGKNIRPEPRSGRVFPMPFLGFGPVFLRFPSFQKRSMGNIIPI